MNTFRTGQYTIATSLNERAIYLKIANNISYMCYEGNFDVTAFKLPFELKDVYELVNKCFAEMDEDSLTDDLEDEDESDNDSKVPSARAQRTESYRVVTRLDNGTLQVLFNCVVGGFLKVKFDLRLREKLMSNDAQLSINFQRVEQKLERIDAVMSQMQVMEKKMKEMERRLEALGHADICFANLKSGNAKDIQSYPIDSKTLFVNSTDNAISKESFEKIKHFYQLEDLHIHRCCWVPSNVASSPTVKKLKIEHSDTYCEISFIKNFPNLEELEMVKGMFNASIVTTLRSIKHKIRKLTFQGITGINQTEMQTYCTQKGIVLNLS